jgi:pimeloyl-ACP methyl ester carboxylesterase
MVDEPVFNGQAYVIEAGRQNKELVVLVHGLGDRAAQTWESVVPQLAQQYHVLTFDLPGFGHSSKTNQLYSPDNYVAFIDFLVKRLGHQEFMLVGHSMGGNIALRYTTTYPQKVRRLMLIDAAGILHRVTYSSFLAHYGVKLLPQFYPSQSGDMREITALLLGQLAARNGFMEMGEQMLLNDPRLRQSILGGEPTTIAAYAMIMADYSERLRGLKTPTLVIWGKQDNVVPLRTGKVLATSLVNAGLVIFDQTGHVPMAEKPARFKEWLARFTQSSDSEFQQILDNTRYLIDTTQPNDSERIVHCQNQSDQLYVGDFKVMIIENCKNVEIDSARIKSLTIKNSDVTLNNCVVQSEGKAVLVEDSSVQVNGCNIIGSPALAFRKAQLDIAGSELKSVTGAALQNLSTERAPPQKTPLPGSLATIERFDTVLFSLSRLSSRYLDKQLHGPVNIEPNQSW